MPSSFPTLRWLRAGRDGCTLSSGCTWAASGLKEALKMRQSIMRPLFKPSSPSLCAPGTVREKERCFFLSFSLRPRGAELPCAGTRQAAQQANKVAFCSPAPCYSCPCSQPQAASHPARCPAALPAILQPFLWVCGAPGQGLLGQGCFPPGVLDCLVRLSQLCSPRLLHPRHARRGSNGPGRPQHASPMKTNPGSHP